MSHSREYFHFYFYRDVMKPKAMYATLVQVQTATAYRLSFCRRWTRTAAAAAARVRRLDRKDFERRSNTTSCVSSRPTSTWTTTQTRRTSNNSRRKLDLTSAFFRFDELRVTYNEVIKTHLSLQRTGESCVTYISESEAQWNALQYWACMTVQGIPKSKSLPK